MVATGSSKPKLYRCTMKFRQFRPGFTKGKVAPAALGVVVNSPAGQKLLGREGDDSGGHSRGLDDDLRLLPNLVMRAPNGRERWFVQFDEIGWIFFGGVLDGLSDHPSALIQKDYPVMDTPA